ncbi:MAG: PKD domain-containing protein [Pedobacter sp.]|nr:MAG: PKD domain-containing protein [Pedobacter sp.]
MKRAGLLALLIFLLVLKKSYAQNVSNEGTDFWAVFPTHVPSQNSLANIAVFVTSKFNTEVTVSCGISSETKVIPANTAVQFNVQRASAYINEYESNLNLSNKGIHIKVKDGMPKVSAYAHIWGRARSAASLILPFETLGQNYYSMNYMQSVDGKNYLAVVAVEDNTSILLHQKNGIVLPITLDKAGDVYEYMSGNSDLTGVYVETDKTKSSCKRFAAFSGSSVITIGGCTGSQDPLYQQLYPTVSWGRNYGIVPFKNRRYILRILAQEDNTTFAMNGISATLKKGEFYESNVLTQSTFISADKLISVAQYSLTQNCSSVNGTAIIGDPEMVMLNPVEFNIKAVTVFSSTLESITERYINVLIRSTKTSSFKINGVIPNTTWSPLDGNASYSYAQIPVLEESLTLTADDGFNAIAYGFGNAESYSYSAGTNLSSNNYLTVVDETRKEESPNGCIGQTVDFKVNLPYQPDRITWTLEGGVPETIANPVPETKTVNGQTTYVYRYPVNKTYTQTGEYHLEVVAHIPANETNCITGDVTTNYVFNIYDLPITAFDAQLTSCANSEVQFTDKSDSKTKDFSITNWLWDFRDGTTSTDQNPKHKFAKEGKYKVLLTVKSGTGCYSEPVEKEIEIFPLPISDFKAPVETCINTEITLQDKSKISNLISMNTIKNWKWDFGDGSPSSTDQNPKHTYSKVGKFTVSLITTSARDCVSEEKTMEITVKELPKAGFTMPDICLKDAVANFVNTTVSSDGSSSGLTYAWDFGDKYLTATDLIKNTSSDKDGKHTYTKADDYNVTLTITNNNGCVDVLTQKFTVNGSVPRANFETLASNTYCSNTIISIKNTSSVDFGKVTKIEVYKDIVNEPQRFETFDYPTSDQQIDLTYEPFGMPATKEYQIKIVAYSGGQCSDFIIKPVMVKASPIITADEILPVCENDGNVVINQFHETSGVVGNGVFTSDGKGMQENGTFNPKIAGVGVHNITKDTEYTLTVTTNPDRCTAITSVSVRVLQSLNPPSSFTPNGDGYNDIWNIKYLETYPHATVEVFNRNGNRIFFSNGYKIPFDGNYQNEQLPVGVYYYIINPRNGRKTVTGPLTIIR